MDVIVNKLLDVDKQARQMLDEAQQFYDHTLLEIEEEKTKLVAVYSEKAQKHVRELDAELAAEVQEVRALVNRRSEKLLAAMEARYNDNHSEWENTLFEKTVMG